MHTTTAATLNRRPTRVLAHAPMLVMVVPLILVCVGFWPGHMSADTLNQIAQVRSFDLTNQHSPLLVALWKPFYDLGAGPGWVLGAQVSAFLAGCYLTLRAAFERLVAALISSVIALWPAVFGMLGYLSRDTWFAALLVLTFGLTVHAARAESGRPFWIAAALASAWLALAARQNAAPAVVLAVIVLAWMLPLPGRRSRGRAKRLGATVAWGVAITLAMIGTQVAAYAALGVHDVAPQQYLYIYDLGNLSLRDHKNDFPRDVMPGDRAFAQLAPHVSPDSVVALVWTPDAPIAGTPLPKQRLDSLSRAWRHEVSSEPLEWLDVRWDLELRNLAVTSPANYIYHPSIDPNPWGYRPTFPGANDAAKDYVEAFATQGPALMGSVVHRVWIYLLAALAASVVLIRRGRSLALFAVAALGLTALTYQAGLFFGTPQNGYRLEFPVVTVALIAVPVALRTVTRRTATLRA
jgi:hypothetical protein